jgi:hypothetical protein
VGVKRKQHSAEFKARVAMAALSGQAGLRIERIHPNAGSFFSILEGSSAALLYAA